MPDELKRLRTMVDNSEKHQTRGTRILKIVLNQFIKTRLLAIYDMGKAVDRGIQLTGARLLENSGGQAGSGRCP